jgi:tetratricopeptide (TPR) repeat protein
MLAERGSLDPDEELPVPDSVHGIIEARLDTLPAGEKAVVQDASVVGRTFWPGAVAHVGSTARWTVDEHLGALERKQFVRRERRSTVEGETEYTFRHLLVRDVAYSRIPRARRLEKHRLAAEWIESLGRPEDHAETFAHHYLQALELARAAGQDSAAVASRARVALREAGDRAAGLKAFPAAARFYSAALGLWPRDDAEWPALRFRYGRALFYAEETGEDVFTEARDALLAAGDLETAAEAEVFLGELSFRDGDRDGSFEHYARAQELLEGTPVSPAKAWLLGTLSRGLDLNARSEEALEVAREAFAMADQLGLGELRAKALMTIGDAKIELGDTSGMRDYEEGIAIAEELGSLESAVGYLNLADAVMDLGDLGRAVELRGRAQGIAERFGDAGVLRWLRPERVGEAYFEGRWNDALRGANEFIAESETGRRHYQEVYCRVVRGRIRLARGDLDGALADAERGLEFARIVKDPQALYPVLAFAARVCGAAGRLEESSEHASELLAFVRENEQTPVAYLWLHELAVAAADLGRGGELLAAVARVRKESPWLEAARAIAAGDFGSAALVYGRIGAKPDEAAARVRAAAALAAAGMREEAEAELRPAAAFYLSVGAEASRAEAERQLAAPA